MRDRRDELLGTLACRRAVSAAVVVGDASGDGTAASVRREAPYATLVSLARKLGAAAVCTGWAPLRGLRRRRLLVVGLSAGGQAARTKERKKPAAVAKAVSGPPSA